MSAGAAVVERWTPESRIVVTGAAIIIAVLAVGPAMTISAAARSLGTSGRL